MASLRNSAALSGHASAVLCCEANHAAGALLLSGSEDGTARLWDLRTLECCQRFERFKADDITSVTFSRIEEHQFFAAGGAVVKCFDFRMGPQAEALASFEYNKDEINHVAVNRKGTFLAAADDSGEVKIVDLATGSLFKTLRGVHTNICSSVQFHPKKIWEIVTGGLDAKLITWDFSKGRSLHVRNLAEEAQPRPETSARLFNPPLIHSIASPEDMSFSDAEHLAVISRGDGAIAVYDLDYRDSPPGPKGAGRKKTQSLKVRAGNYEALEKRHTSQGLAGVHTESARNSRIVEGRWSYLDADHGGHKSSAAYAGFARFAKPGEFLISGGNDGRVKLWRWQEAVDSRNIEKESDEESYGGVSGIRDGMDKLSVESAATQVSGAEPLVFDLRHGRKVNWLATSQLGGGKVVIADTSKRMTMYDVG